MRLVRKPEIGCQGRPTGRGGIREGGDDTFKSNHPGECFRRNSNQAREFAFELPGSKAGASLQVADSQFATFRLYSVNGMANVGI